MSEKEVKLGLSESADPSWVTFKKWAEGNGINMEAEEDWLPWWDCWSTAFKICSGLMAEAIRNQPYL